MLARAHDIDVATAFELLRRHARNNQRKLHDAAAELLAGTIRL